MTTQEILEQLLSLRYNCTGTHDKELIDEIENKLKRFKLVDEQIHSGTFCEDICYECLYILDVMKDEEL